MSLTHQQYADLAEDSYEDRLPSDENVDINGVAYKVLEHKDNKLNGYQGTIYQPVDTGEIVAAHRVTEFGWRNSRRIQIEHPIKPIRNCEMSWSQIDLRCSVERT